MFIYMYTYKERKYSNNQKIQPSMNLGQVFKYNFLKKDSVMITMFRGR